MLNIFICTKWNSSENNSWFVLAAVQLYELQPPEEDEVDWDLVADFSKGCKKESDLSDGEENVNESSVELVEQKTVGEMVAEATKKEIERDPDILFKSIAMCEFTLIQSFDDLKAAETLLEKEHYSQSVFMSSQVVEKALKSLLSLLKRPFITFFNLHSAEVLVDRLQNQDNNMVHSKYHEHHEHIKSLCWEFESIGADSWECYNPLSIRSRYFNFQTEWWGDFFETRYLYYVDSYPGNVYTADLSLRAFEIAKEIFETAEKIHEQNWSEFTLKYM
jgi:HEPN domain-containing protein